MDQKQQAHRQTKVSHPKVYYLDSLRHLRCFPGTLRWCFEPGDVDFVPAQPSLCKSRPIGAANAFAVLMKLDYVRHFIFLDDKLDWTAKKNQAIFRGVIGKNHDTKGKQARFNFMQKWFGHPMFDLGEVSKPEMWANREWLVPKRSIYDHLNYKFVMSLEGNDVASNLKWVMSSNSLAVSPKLRNESWFMEGTLIPGYHFVEVKDDFSDVEDKMNYYINHPAEAQAIIQHAHEYIKQFRDEKREAIISLLVLDKYFRLTNN